MGMILKRIHGSIPNDAQANNLRRNIDRAFLHSTLEFQWLCRICPWCTRTIPTTIARCLICNAQTVSAERFQRCLGTPRALDSEIRITADEAVEVVEHSTQVTATDEQVNDELELAERDAAATDVEEIHESQSPDEEERRMRRANEGLLE